MQVMGDELRTGAEAEEVRGSQLLDTANFGLEGSPKTRRNW